MQRWVKMSKHLPEFGWEPIVFKPQNPEYPLIDHSFDEEVKSSGGTSYYVVETVLSSTGAAYSPI